MSATVAPSLDERILAALHGRGGSFDQVMECVPRTHPDALRSRLRALKLSGHIQVSPFGLYGLAPPRAHDEIEAEQPAIPAPAPTITGSKEMTETKKDTCAKCGSTDFTESGNCRPCKRKSNAAYNAKKAGGGRVKKAIKNLKAKAAGVKPDTAPAADGPLVVANGYTLRIPDSAGTLHVIEVTRDMSRALHEQLEAVI